MEIILNNFRLVGQNEIFEFIEKILEKNTKCKQTPTRVMGKTHFNYLTGNGGACIEELAVTKVVRERE